MRGILWKKHINKKLFFYFRQQRMFVRYFLSHQEVDVHPPQQGTVSARLCCYGALKQSSDSVTEAVFWQ